MKRWSFRLLFLTIVILATATVIYLFLEYYQWQDGEKWGVSHATDNSR
jgi:hypothetical protein